MKLNYGISIFHKPTNETIHFVFYESKPTKVVLKDLKEELISDPEFGFGKKIIDECKFYLHSSKSKVFEQWKEIYEDLRHEELKKEALKNKKRKNI